MEEKIARNNYRSSRISLGKSLHGSRKVKFFPYWPWRRTYREITSALEVSGQHHSPAALLPEKRPAVPIH